MASAAERDQILLGIFTPMAPESNVVELNRAQQSAEVALPTIPLQNLLCAELRTPPHLAGCNEALQG